VFNMSLFIKFKSLLRNLFLPSRVERDLDQEVRSHLEMLTGENIRAGMSPEEAKRGARIELGGIEQVKEQVREERMGNWLQSVISDCRYGLRQLRKNPGFTAVAVLTLALGIGANTAIFSVVNSVLLQPLPFPNAHRLVRAFGKSPITDSADVSPADFLDYRAQNHLFDHFEGLIDGNPIFNLAGYDKPTQVKGAVVTAGFFDALGIQPLLGRTFVAADEGASHPQVVVLSHRLWQEQFGSDAGVIGKSVDLDGSRMTIVGVLGKDVPLFSDGDVWIPAPFEVTGMRSRPSRFLRVIGVLKAETNLSQAQAELDMIATHLAQQYPDSNTGWSIRLVPLQTVLVGYLRPALLILLGSVTLVLLIACANVASLLLARNSSRTREIAIRRALGAGQLRLVRQMLTESVLLALAGGAAGLALANWGLQLLIRLGPGNLPRLNELSLNGTVLVFTGGIAVLTGILCGLGPALQAGHRDSAQNLKEGSATGQSKSKHRVHNVLVIAEVALSLVVLIASGLLLNSLWRLTHVDPGFDPSNIVTAQISVTTPALSAESQRLAFLDKLDERIVTLPGVVSVGFVSEMPLSGQANDTYVTIAEHPPVGPAERLDADLRIVAGSYFQAMRIPLLQGREFSIRDADHSPLVVIINEPFAKQYFPGENPIGKHLNIYEGRPEFVTREIVGVVGGIKHFALQEPLRPEMFLPYRQFPALRMNIVLRGSRNPLALASAIRTTVSSIDPDETTSSFRTLGEIVSTSAAGDRFSAFLLGAFGCIALLLTVVGIFGVLSYLVAQRTREIGLRMALGAQQDNILAMVIGHGMVLVLVGLTLGLVGAYAVTRLMSSLLFEVKPTDPATFFAVSAVLATAGYLACYLPARRATRVDPIIALRYE
jgi:predicted permease